MLSKQIEQKLNEQLQKEFFSFYFYLSMEAYLANQNLDGFANFFHVQAQEEFDHAIKFFNYITERGGRVELEQLNKPKMEFASPVEVFEIALEHEQFITRSIHSIVDTAVEERDHTTNAFLQWFVNEQVEEEASMDKVLRKLKLAGADGAGLFMIDNELAQRVYVPLPTGNTPAG